VVICARKGEILRKEEKWEKKVEILGEFE